MVFIESAVFTKPVRELLSDEAYENGLLGSRSKSVHVDDSGGERLRRLLRKVVPNAASQVPVCVFAGELRGMAAGAGCGAPLASPSSVMVGTVMTGPAASRFSRAS